MSEQPVADTELTAWRVTCPPEVFSQLRSDERFWQLIALARLVNALRFSQAALPGHDDDSPHGVRQRFNSFFHTAALLKEGIPLVQRLGKHFRHLPAYRERFLPILQDRSVEQLLGENLKPLRDEAVSHFLENELGARLNDHDLDDLYFITGLGRSQGQTYYQMADMVAIRALTGPTPREEFVARARDLVRRTTDLALRFLIASDCLIGEALRSMGWLMKRGAAAEGA